MDNDGDAVDLKTCSRCGAEKLPREFYKHAGGKDGLRAECKECRRAYDQARYAANPEKHRARFSAWYENNREKERAATATWRAENPGRNGAACAAWRAANPEKSNAARAAWKMANSERVKRVSAAWRRSERGRESNIAHTHSRRAKAGPALARETVAELKAEYGGLCPYCQRTITGRGHIDHIVPIISGGTNERANLVYCCAACNRAKGARTLLQFVLRRRVDAARMGVGA